MRPRTVNGPAAPQIDRFYTDPSQPTPGQTVTFYWWAGDNDGLIRGHKIAFGDGTNDEQLFADRCFPDPSDPVQQRAPFRHSYGHPGTFQAHLTVISGGSCGDGPLQSVAADAPVSVALVSLNGLGVVF